MALGKFIKSPNEIKRYSVDYVNWLDTGEYLSSATVTPPAGTLLADVGALGATPTQLSFVVTGGDAGKSYKLTVSATTTTGQVKQDTVLIEVRAL